MRTEPDRSPTTIKYRSTPEYKDGNRENQRARETAVPFRLMWPDTRDFRKLTPTFRNSGWYQWVDATPAEIYSKPRRLRTSIGTNLEASKRGQKSAFILQEPRKTQNLLFK